MMALILGGAGSLWSDVDRALAAGQYDAVVACNDAGAVWPGRLDHWVSLHPSKDRCLIAQRHAAGFPGGYVTWAHASVIPRPPEVERTLPDWSGSSGLFAVAVALHLGYRCVLAGIPMDGASGHFFDARPWVPGPFHRAWSQRAAMLRLVRRS